MLATWLVLVLMDLPVFAGLWGATARAGQAASSNDEFHWDSHAWQELSATDSLRNTKVSQSDREAIVAAIARQLRQDMGIPGLESEKQLRRATLDTRVKLIHLSRDRVPEVVAQAFVNCSATGNCPFWIFQKKMRYQLILKSFGKKFKVERKRTKGYREIDV